MGQEVTTQSWFGRIGKAFVGMLFGIIFIIGSFIGLFWNESHGYHTAQSLQEAEQVLIPAEISPINPQNDLKVVYLSGLATTNQTLQDNLLGISTTAIKLERKVDMYQWKEHEETQTETSAGGSEREVKTYTYKKEWSPSLIDSSNFKDPNGHQNPQSMLTPSVIAQAEKVTVGDFYLPASLISQISVRTPVDLSQVNVAALQTQLNKTVQHDGSTLYLGDNIQTPQIGDLRIVVQEVLPQVVSIVAQQVKNTLQPYMAHAGEPVELLYSGQLSSQQVIHQAEMENQSQIWTGRLVTLIFMIMGFMLIFQPLVVLADVIPFFGRIVGFGTFLASLLGGLILWSVALAIAWFAVRPLLALAMIVAIIIVCYGLFSSRKPSKA